MLTDSTSLPRSLLPGKLVRDNRSRVGRVVGQAGTVEDDGDNVALIAVDFWGREERRPERWLTPLGEDCPEALLVDRPDELMSWAEDAPLRLVALALSVDGGTGKAADIRSRLAGRVIEEERWENWWNRRTKALSSLPKHFRSVKAAKGNQYTLLCGVDDVPADLKPAAKAKSATAADWRKWLRTGAPENVPGRYPTKPVVEALAKWGDAETIEQVLTRLEVTAEGLLSRGDVSPQEAESWLTAIASAAIRRRETGGADPRGYDAARAGEVLARLSRIAGERTPLGLLLQAGAIDGTTDAWRRGFLAGMWDSFDGDGAREMYLGASTVLGRQARSDLARQITLAAFGPDFSERRHSELDRLLDTLPDAQRSQLLNEIIATAQPEQREGVLDYIAKSRHAEGSENLELRLVATLTLADERSELAARTSRELANALEPQNHSVDAGPVQFVFSATVERVSHVKANEQRKAEEREAAREAELEQERAEQERLRQQVRERNAELAANREESRLGLRQDMLLVIGELLQAAQGWNSLDDAVRDVEAGIALALGAGGAELLESNGKWVDFDTLLHNAEESVHPGTRVRVVAPGVIYRGGIHGDRVLLKAKVKHEAG